MLRGYFRVYSPNALVITFLVNYIQALCSYIYLLSLVKFKKYTSAQAFNILLLLPNLIKWKLIPFLLNLLLLLVNQRYLLSSKIPPNSIAAPLNAILLETCYPTKISTKALIRLYVTALLQTLVRGSLGALAYVYRRVLSSTFFQSSSWNSSSLATNRFCSFN